MSEEDDASVHLLEETMSAAWRFHDWVSAAEDPELYVMRILINQFTRVQPMAPSRLGARSKPLFRA